jgi:hypothetical protein
MKLRALFSPAMSLAVALLVASAAHSSAADTEPTPAKIPASLFEAFQLSAYLKEQSIEDIMDAIQVAWQTEPTHSATAIRLKFHAGTKQLFVYASQDALAVTRTVIAQLNPLAITSVSSVVLNLTPADEQKRLQAVAAEVRRRRALREIAAASPSTIAKITAPAITPLPPAPVATAPVLRPVVIDPAFKEEIQRRRDSRASTETKLEASTSAEKK